MENFRDIIISDIERRNIAVNLINFAFSEIERRYGTGVGGAETPRFYHNLDHTKNVVESSRKIAELAVINNKINASDTILIEIAASFHDIEQNLGPGLNERECVRILEERIAKTSSFSPSDLEKIERMILSTIVSWNGEVMKQSETDDYLTKIIADADLSSLGQPPEIYWDAAQKLLREIKNTDSPSLRDQLDWAQGQIKFLSNHEFHTNEARKIFSNKQTNIEFIKEQVKRLEKEINQAN